MRLTTVILIASLIQVSAAGLAQKVTLAENKAVLTKVFDKISNQTGYDFLFTTTLLKNAKPVTIQVNNANLDEVLKQIFDDQPFQYTIGEKSVVIKEKEPSLLDRARVVIQSAAKDLLQDLTARGKILDENGKPLEGATIVVKGTSRTTKTDAKGEFVMANILDDGVLVIRYVGYKQLEISLKDAVLPLEIKLNVATGELEEVKVTYSTGYQNIPKERATGSFVQIDKELFNRAVSTNVLDRILEVTNSLKVEQTPMQNASPISIRGFSTINANMKPLIVVDGFPYEEYSPIFNTITLENLNPNDFFDTANVCSCNP